MPISASTSENEAVLTIHIRGRFDFSMHQEFRNCYEKLAEKPQRYRIDMEDTTYLDSSALGMLLLLRDYAGGDNAEICLENCSRDVRKILTISNFEQLFEIN